MSGVDDNSCGGKLAFIALGANMGEPQQQLQKAVDSIAAHPQITPLAMSKMYRSKPHGVSEQSDFINAVLEVRTTLNPQELLVELQAIELQHGRDRSENAVRWGPRLLDLDIILYAKISLTSPSLTLPHPLAYQREFVLQPLCDLNPSLNLPGYGRVDELLKKLPLEHLEAVKDGETYNS